MCGRYACTLEGCHFQRARAYPNKAGNPVLPVYSYKYEIAPYAPNFNMAPTSITPVLVSAKFESNEKDITTERSERVLWDMCWGITPSWNYSTKINNAKSETILEKDIFKIPFTSGQRCVVAVNGFYEWQKIDPKFKQPYFVYWPSDIEWQALDYDDLEKYWNASKGWTGPKLLNMAGLFSKTPETQLGPKYSYTVVTIGSQEPFASIHSRVPVILETDEEINTWLDSKSSIVEVKNLLKPPTKLEWYPVSDRVNNSRNHDPSCLVKTEPNMTPQKKTATTRALLPGQSSITSFFRTSSASKTLETGSGDHSKAKKPKLNH